MNKFTPLGYYDINHKRVFYTIYREVRTLTIREVSNGKIKNIGKPDDGSFPLAHIKQCLCCKNTCGISGRKCPILCW
jgi:hypothetical protein